MIKLVDVKYLPEKDVYEISKESIVKSNTEFRMMKLQRDELINDIADIKRKAEAWDNYKDELREMVIYGYHSEEGTPSKYMNEAYRIILNKMCQLDGTNDFKNLLSDLERGSDE